jgi:hypothetical protein
MSVRRAEKAMILARLERLHTLLNQLDRATGGLGERKKVRAHIRRELQAAKRAVKTLTTHEPA